MPSTQSTRQLSFDKLSCPALVIRSLRSEFELVDEGLKRLTICEIGNPSGALLASKLRMMAMPSCAYESFLPRAVSVITATSFMNCS